MDIQDPDIPTPSGGEEYPYSLGTGEIIRSIEKYKLSMKRPIWDSVLINFATVVRNNVEKGKPARAVEDDSFKDAVGLVDAFQQYWETTKEQSDVPQLVFYVHDYQIPSIYARKISPTNKLVEEYTAGVGDRISGKSEEENYNGISVLNIKSKGPTPVPNLMRECSLHQQRLKSKRSGYSRRYLLISHIPIDFHIMEIYRNVHLLESYTGNLKVLGDIGTKLFKTPAVPFNTVTHVTFGDSVHIDAVAKRANKKKLFQQAQEQRWKLLSETQIANQVSGALGVPKIFFSNLKLT